MFSFVFTTLYCCQEERINEHNRPIPTISNLKVVEVPFKFNKQMHHVPYDKCTIPTNERGTTIQTVI